jgi:hypothetical protein
LNDEIHEMEKHKVPTIQQRKKKNVLFGKTWRQSFFKVDLSQLFKLLTFFLSESTKIFFG